MVCKRYKSNAAAEFLQKVTNAHFVNPFTKKIDLKMFIKHLHEKDEFENDELDIDWIHYGSCSDNQLLVTNDFHSNSDISDSEILTTQVKQKKKVKAGSAHVNDFGARSLSQNDDIRRGFYFVLKILALRMSIG